jgi:hypothetical protein
VGPCQFCGAVLDGPVHGCMEIFELAFGGLELTSRQGTSFGSPLWMRILSSILSFTDAGVASFTWPVSWQSWLEASCGNAQTLRD